MNTIPESLEPQFYVEQLSARLYFYKPLPQPSQLPSASDGMVSDLGVWDWDSLEHQETFQELANDHPHLNFFVVIQTITTDLEGLI